MAMATGPSELRLRKHGPAVFDIPFAVTHAKANIHNSQQAISRLVDAIPAWFIIKIGTTFIRLSSPLDAS